MKALKIILIVVVAAAAVFLIMGLFAPKDVRVERSIQINAPTEIVFSYSSSLQQADLWSPWSKLDTTATRTYTGNEGEVGSMVEWDSDHEKLGAGTQTVTSIEENKRVGYQIVMTKPYAFVGDAYVEMEETEDGFTNVTWGFYQELSYPMNAMMLFMDLDKQLGGMYEEGLATLKELADNNYEENKLLYMFDIVPAELPMRTYVVVKDTVKWADMSNFFETNFGKTFGAVAKAKLTPEGAASGLYFNWDTENKQAVMAAGVPVKQGSKVNGFETVDAGGKAMHIAYYGSYEGSESAHNALGMYLEKNNLEMNGPVLEEYITDPTTEPDTSKWLTNIYYFIK